MGLDKDIYKYKQVQNRISSYKNSLITVKAYHQNPELVEADAMAKRPRMGDIYQNYVDRCFKAGAMDFDDLLLRTNELLTRFPGGTGEVSRSGSAIFWWMSIKIPTTPNT